jgi:putative acetyltransferase
VVRSINEAAFGRPDEADLVDSLRSEGAVLLSLVAEMERRIVGHVLFSRMSIETSNGPVPAAALAPIAVLPQSSASRGRRTTDPIWPGIVARTR